MKLDDLISPDSSLMESDFELSEESKCVELVRWERALPESVGTKCRTILTVRFVVEGARKTDMSSQDLISTPMSVFCFIRPDAYRERGRDLNSRVE